MTDTRLRTTWGTRFRFALRVVGLTGILAAVAGAVLLATVFTTVKQWTVANLTAAAQGDHGPFGQTATWILLGGMLAVGAALIVELLATLTVVTGRRTAASTSATLATLAATALLLAVNAYSFTHHARFDFTRDQHLTLPAAVAEQLRTLRADVPTTIVVFQQHKTFGTLSDKPDSYDYAAERKVVEKVKDLVDLFRELGPRFNVVVLDVEDDNYEQRLADLTQDAPELKAAIAAAPENSIFVAANHRVQRLAFNEFMQLDKTASQQAHGGRGNLVLLPQGVERFARRVLAVHERRPRVAVCVVHELLTSAYPEGRGRFFTLAGLRRSLTDHGFEVVDIVLKKNWAGARSIDDLKPAADTREESKLERLEGEVVTAQNTLNAANRNAQLLERVQAQLDAVKGRPWAERQARYEQLFRGVVTEDVEPEILASVAQQVTRSRQMVDEARSKLQAAENQLKQALADERTTEERRITDARAKLARKLADVDLLIIPRFTIEDATEGESPDVPVELHNLTRDQVEVIREFMASGKPVLACLGPISGPDGPEPADGLERLLAERGVHLGSETILFEGETRAFAARLAGEQFGGGLAADIPPLVLVETPEGKPEVKPNPIAAATRLTARSAGRPLELQAKALRPVYLADFWRDRVPFAAEFLFTGPDAWNEQRPFFQTEPRRTPDGRLVRVVTYIPQFEATTETEPAWGTRAAERKAAFPVGVALEAAPPAYWTSGLAPIPAAGLLLAGSGWHRVATAAAALDQARPQGPPSRLVVFGSGNIFSGPDLKPAQEKLLLHTVNWLTRRDDRLPQASSTPWQFPRVAMSDRDLTLWRLGTAIGLPLLAVYLGLLAMLVRRLR
jgi:hypothetical protein